MRFTGSVILEEVAKYKAADQTLTGVIRQISEIESGGLQTDLPGRLA